MRDRRSRRLLTAMGVRCWGVIWTLFRRLVEDISHYINADVTPGAQNPSSTDRRASNASRAIGLSMQPSFVFGQSLGFLYGHSVT